MRARFLISVAALAVVLGGGCFVWLGRVADPVAQTPTLTHRPPEAKPSRPRTGGVPMGNLLLREIVRQGWLIAQRDQLGLATRDRVLREPARPDSASPPDLDVKPYFDADCLTTAIGDNGQDLPGGKWSMTIPAADWKAGYLSLVVAVDKLSRGEMVAALQSMGFKGSPIKPRAGSPPDLSNAEQRLDEVNFSKSSNNRTIALTTQQPT